MSFQKEGRDMGHRHLHPLTLWSPPPGEGQPCGIRGCENEKPGPLQALLTMTKGDVLSFLPGEQLSSRHASTAPGGWPLCSLMKAAGRGHNKAFRGQHLANQLDDFPRCSAEVCPAGVRLGGSDHLTSALGSLSSSRCLFTSKRDPLLQLGSQCTARS